MVGGYDKNGRPRDGRGVSYTYEGGAPLGYCPEDEPPISDESMMPGFVYLILAGAGIFYGWSYFPIQIRWVIIFIGVCIFRKTVFAFIGTLGRSMFAFIKILGKSVFALKKRKIKKIVIGEYDEFGNVVEIQE